MGTRLSVSGGGKAFDGTDYIYVYGDKDPVGNGQELQSALYQAGIDKVATGRPQTVVVGPGTYSPQELGDYFQFDGQAARVRSLTGDTDVILQTQGPSKMLAFNSNEYGDMTDLTSGINSQIYAANLAITAQFGYSTFLNNTKCKSDYIDLENGTLILHNESGGNTSSDSGQRLVAVTSTGYTIGPNLNVTFPNFNMDFYSLLRNPTTNQIEIYMVGYWNVINNRVLFKIDPITLDVDPSFAYVQVQGGLSDIVIVNNSDIVVVGGFNTINFQPSVNIAKISSAGVVNTSTFGVGAGFNSYVNTVTYSPISNRIYCGGGFTQYQGINSKYFAIINNPDGQYIAPGGNPNSTVYSLKYFKDDNVLYAFGGFSLWNGNSTNGKNAILQLDGTFSGTVFNDNVTNFYDSNIVKATINGGTQYLRFAVNNSNATTLNGSPISYGNVIEWNIIASNFVAYSPAPYANSYNPLQSGTVFYVLYSRHDAETFTGYGYVYYANLKILEVTGSGYYYEQPKYAHINGLQIGGGLVIGNVGIQVYRINNCKVSTVYDVYSYNNIPQPPNMELEIYNSQVETIVFQSSVNVYQNSFINSMYVSNSMLAAGNVSFGRLRVENSTVRNAYNSRGIFIMDLYLLNADLSDSFNNAFSKVINGTNNYTRVDSIYARNCTIYGSFTYALLPRFRLYNCAIGYSFRFDYLPSDVSQDVLIRSAMMFQGEAYNITGSASFNYNFQNSLRYYPDLTNMYFQNVQMRFENCNLNGGDVLTFAAIPANMISNTHFINCNALDPNGNSSYAMYIMVMPDYNAGDYQLGSGEFGNIFIENCTAVNYSNAFVVGLIPKQNYNQVYIRNIQINNCVHNSFVYYYDFQINQSTTFFLDSGLGFVVSNFILDRGRITNCSVDAGIVINSFFSNFYNLTSMTIVDYLFKNCHVNHRAESFYINVLGSFFSFITASNLSIATNPGAGLRFEDCSTSAPSAPYASNDWVPSYQTVGFLGLLSIGSFNSGIQRPVVFINCSAMRGFISGINTNSVINGSAYVYAKDCVAYNFSFGKSVTSLYGQFINCDGGYGSFGDAFDFGSGLAATYGSATFVGCQGRSPFGLDKALPTILTINGAGYLYHFTTIGWSGGSPVASGLINWNVQQYNV